MAKNCKEFIPQIRQLRDNLMIIRLSLLYYFLWRRFLHYHTIECFRKSLLYSICLMHLEYLSCLLEFFASFMIIEWTQLWHTSNSRFIIIFKTFSGQLRIFHFFLVKKNTFFLFKKIRWNSNLLFKTHISADWACNFTVIHVDGCGAWSHMW